MNGKVKMKSGVNVSSTLPVIVLQAYLDAITKSMRRGVIPVAIFDRLKDITTISKK